MSSDKSYTSHYSVLKMECIDFLKAASMEQEETSFFADLTFGGGGHSFALLAENPNIKIVALDQDPEAYSAGLEKIKENKLEDRITLLNYNFAEFSELVNSEYKVLLDGEGFSGIIADLGVSSHHFDEDRRGFSFRFDGPLDMRMNNQSDGITASFVVNTYSKEELEAIFRKYGEEKFSSRIAENIVEGRIKNPINTTRDLENIIFHSYPKKMRHFKTNPSTRCFQALRIFVNDELNVLESSIPKLFELLRPGGVLAIISFHSLEDRIVKHSFKKIAAAGLGKILTKKPIVPSDEEIRINRRSRSAKLRVIKVDTNH